MVNPETITVTAVLAATEWKTKTMTKKSMVKLEKLPQLTPLMVAAGDPAPAKKPDGYVSVMVLPVASAPPAVVVNENVAAAPVLPAKRWDDAIANKGLVT
jgi:hypothetical protein